MPKPEILTSTTPKSRRIQELDGIRAVAIIMVLGCHYEGFSQLLWRIPELGWMGVDLFFCLSGYLITSILLGLKGKEAPYKTFYARRLIRILPSYLAVITLVGIYDVYHRTIGVKWLVTQVLFLQAFHSSQFHQVWEVLTHCRWYLLHLPSLTNNGTFLPLEQAGAPLSLSVVPFTFWSLSIEEYFYLLWAPIVLRLPRKAIVLIAVAICVTEIFLRWVIASSDTYYGMPFRFDALLYGAFLALLLEYWQRTSTPSWATSAFTAILTTSLLGITSVGFAIRPFLGNDPRPSPLVLAVGMPLLSIAFAATIGLLILRTGSPWWPWKLLRTRTFLFVGTISYTMYLVHLIAANVVRFFCGVKNPTHQNVLQALLSTVLTVGLARLSWVLLEKKFLHWKDRRFPSVPLVPR